LQVKSIRQNIITALVACFMFTMSGCVYLIVGGVGALGGYVISPDTVEGITNNDSMTVWDAANEVIAIMGVVQESHEVRGILEAKVHGVSVSITVSAMGTSSSKLTVRARKYRLPRIATAQDIFVKIMSYLNE